MRIALILLLAFLIPPAYAASTDGCDMFWVSFECDLSGWMKLLLGDVAIAATLAIFLHFLAHRSNAKIEQNTKAIKNNSTQIQKILDQQQQMKMQRQAYVIQSFKNQFGALLLCLGILHKFPDNKKERINEIETILSRTHNTLNLSIDVIEPMLIDQIEKFLHTKSQLLDDIANDKLNYQSIKENIINLTERLNQYSQASTVLK